MKTFILFIISCLPLTMFGQEIEQCVVANAGSEDKSVNATISWTIGEVATKTLSTTNITLSQGFHQGKLIINQLDEVLDFQIKAYPNPVHDLLILEIKEQGLKYKILNQSGKVLLNGISNSDQAEINFTKIPNGFYFLQVEGDKTHKIIKQ